MSPQTSSSLQELSSGRHPRLLTKLLLQSLSLLLAIMRCAHRFFSGTILSWYRPRPLMT